MSKFGLIAFALTLSFAAHAKTYTCTGVYDDNKGTEVVLKLTAKGYSVYGTAVAGEGFTAQVNCSGKFSETRGKYDVYTTVRDAKVCPISYVKIMTDVSEKGSGMLALARSSGGDTHDSSGYAYRFYHCE
jgi:hypothetical protein